MATLAVSIAANSVAAPGATARKTPAALAGGTGNNDRVGGKPLRSRHRAAVEREPLRSFPDRAHGHTSAHGEASGCGERGREPAHAAGDRREHRTSGRVSGAITGRGGGTRCGDKRAALTQLRRQGRQRRLQRDPVGSPGVHTGQQRLDQPIDDFVSEPIPNQLTDADVSNQWRQPRPRRLDLDGGQRRGTEQAGCPRGRDVERNAHQRSRRERVQRSRCIDGRGGRHRID
jgi:hypothetical protein